MSSALGLFLVWFVISGWRAVCVLCIMMNPLVDLAVLVVTVVSLMGFCTLNNLNRFRILRDRKADPLMDGSSY